MYPTRCRIIDIDGKVIMGRVVAKTPAQSLPHIGKCGLAELVDTDRVRITLDDGNIIWGHECWWEPVDTTPTPADPTPTAKLISLNDLSNECGYFGTGKLFFDAHVPNDGYICNHPAQEETEAGFGLCHRWSCPLARQATMADLRELDADLYRQYSPEFPADDDVPSGGEDWMVREATPTRCAREVDHAARQCCGGSDCDDCAVAGLY